MESEDLMNKIVSLYLSRRDVPTRMDVVQGSVSPGITFILEDYEPNVGAQAQIFIKKKESEVFNACTVSGNEVTFNPTTGSFDEVGECQGQLQIISGEKIAVSYRLFIKVEPNIIDGDAIEASDDFSALQEALMQIEDIDEYKAQTETNTQDISGIKAKTDLMTIGNEMLWAVSAAGSPYQRWIKNGIWHQFLIGPEYIVYEKYENGAWTNVWRINSSSYLAGESITISAAVNCAGFITAGGKNLNFQIPLPRRTMGRTVTVALNKTNGLSVRTGAGGYVENVEYIDTTASGYEVIPYPNESGVFVTITKPNGAAWANVQNNMAISANIRGTITFS